MTKPKDRAHRLSALGLAALLLAFPLAAQKNAKEAEKVEDPQQYSLALALGEEHNILSDLLGTWEGDLKVMLQGTPPREVPAKDLLVTKWILDGKHLHSEHRLTIEAKKSPTLSMAWMGYNPALKRFFRLHLSSQDPREIFSTGTWDPATRTLTFLGTEHDPVTGDSFEKKDVFRFVDADHLEYELHFVFQDKSSVRAVRGTYTRKK